MTADRDDRELGAPLVAYLTGHIAGFGGECRIRQFLGGQSNPTYLIEDTSGAYILRKKPPGQLLPSAHAVDREYRVISALADSAVPVPGTHVLCTDEGVIGQMFYIMDYMPGRVFTDREMPGCSPCECARRVARGGISKRWPRGLWQTLGLRGTSGRTLDKPI
jgi:aminoglycoside phosphotransferase (APT) family kinase protein